MSVNFNKNEKCALADKIAKQYFEKNFGSMTKADLETLLFSEYIEHCINYGIPYDDYTLSKELGITQTRIRSLKERKELKYPREKFNWKEAFGEALKNAKYDETDHYIKMIIEDVNVMNEVRHYIETQGWYDECTPHKKLLRIPLKCFIDICTGECDLDDVFTEEAKENIKKLSKKDSAVNSFIEDFSKEGLKAFLMSASKGAIGFVLQQLSFGGLAKVGFDFLADAITK